MREPSGGAMPTPHLTVDHHPTPADRQFLEDRLYDYNREAVGRDDGQLLAVYLRGEDDEILAGAAGWTWAGVCEIQAVWVHPRLRGQGWGRRLVLAAEAAARERGAQSIFLATYDFQAPGFYQKLGYEIIARIEGLPPGHTHLHLRKQLRLPPVVISNGPPAVGTSIAPSGLPQSQNRHQPGTLCSQGKPQT